MNNAEGCINSGKARSEYRRPKALSHPLAAEALQFWRHRPSDGIVIGRDVPSRIMAGLLSRAIVYEPVEGGRDVKVQLAGSDVRRRFAGDITGRRLSELLVADDCAMWFDTVKEAIARNAPKIAAISHRVGAIELLRLELLTLPVAAPRGNKKWALTFCFHL